MKRLQTLCPREMHPSHGERLECENEKQMENTTPYRQCNVTAPQTMFAGLHFASLHLKQSEGVPI